MVVLVGIQAPYGVFSLKALSFEQQKYLFFVWDLTVTHNETLVYADWLVNLKPRMALYVTDRVTLCWLSI
jgi:hypothetical protein